MPLISLITPHADRPDAVKLCEKYVRRFQAPDGYQVEWVLVDGGEVPERGVEPDIYVRNDKYRHPAQNLCSNFLKGLESAKGELLFIIENDDWYRSDYLVHMVGLLQSAEMAGLGFTRYYHVPTLQFREHGNKRHSSLFSTAFRCEIVDKIVPHVEGMLRRRHVLIDVRLWRECDVSKQVSQQWSHAVGMKGLPGKPGITAAHRLKGEWQPDADGDWLRAVVGDEDCEAYMELRNQFAVH